MIIKHPQTIKEAIDDLQVFLESDLWYSSQEEWRSKDDCIEYLRGHFDILEKQIIKLIGKKRYEKEYKK